MVSSRPIDFEALNQLHRLAGLALSPDGSQVVCSLSRPDPSPDGRGRLSQLWLLPTAGPVAARALTQCGDKDSQPAWSPDGRQIAFLARREQQGRRDESRQLYLIAADGGEARRISELAAGIEAFKWMPDGRHIVFMAWVWPELRGLAAQNRRQREFAARLESGLATSEAQYRHFDENLPVGRVLQLLRLNVASGRIRLLMEGSGLELPRAGSDADSFDISPDGRRIVFEHDPAAVQQAGQRHALAELNLAERRIRPLLDDPAWSFRAPRFAPQGGGLALLATPRQPTHTELARLALIAADAIDSAAVAWQLLPAEQAPVCEIEPSAPLRWAPDGRSIFFAAQQQGRCHLWRRPLAEAAAQRVWTGGWLQSFDIASPPEAGTTEPMLALAADSLQHPVRLLAGPLAPVSRVGPGGAALQRIDAFNDELLAGMQLGRVQEVTIKGALGEPVQMWLVFPPGFNARKKHPLLQVIHGGPYSASGDTFSYRWNAHLLASQGHVVAMVNYHGSSGFGHAFRHSIMGRMGELELQDIEAGSDWLLAQPWADRRRLYASGGSYGGFMVAWMNGHVPAGRYRAYICHAGVFDRVATWSADSYLQRHRDLGATYWADPAKVAAQNPLSFAAAMDTPTLITQGALDYRVPEHNALAYYNTLKARGVDARLLWFPDENHWILKPANSRQWYGEVHAWLARHGGPA